jgi:asparagine synthase (glutamine-hydrolysing)
MCGITGFVYKDFVTLNVLQEMRDSIAYRGPDDKGEFLNAYNNDYQIGLAHRRLSIQDLSPLGHQPMFSDDHNIVVVYNGEVYNFKKIRKELETIGFTFKSHSDTEVIIKAYQAFGIEFIDRLNGMFAIALYDQTTHDFYLIRDRLGVKPLYYTRSPKGIIFGSELKPLMLHPDFNKTINNHALSLFLYHGYITAPHTIFENTFKLMPGTYLHFKDGALHHKTYWSVKEQFKNRKIATKDENQWINELDALLTDSIQDRMIGDVPIGAFLSGGADSSLVTALMQKVSTTPVKTFTIGFHEADFNEATYAKKVAAHLGTDHHEMYLPIQKAEDLIASIPTYYDEPFADSSQLPTMLLSEMTRQHVTVALSGDGGDELFCGYGRYTDVERLQRFKPFAKIASHIPFFKKTVQCVTSNSKYTQFFELTDDHAIINSAYLNYLHTMPLIKGHTMTFDNGYEDIMSLSSHIQEKHMLQDMVTYLPDDILTKVDRASMANSLETRAPLVDDHRVIELSFSMPHDMKVRAGVKKYALKKLLQLYLPDELINRPKMGFGVPIYDWLRGDLKGLVNHYLSDGYIAQQGIFDVSEIKKIRIRFFNYNDAPASGWLSKDWKLHKDGAIDRMIWHLVVFQLWHEKWLKTQH